MATFTKFNLTVDDMVKAVNNYNTDSLKVMLTNTAPVATNHVYADISATELANGNGYLTGGAAVPATSASNTSGTETVAGSSITWTATGAVGPFRYAVLYDSTPATKTLIGYWDYGSSVTLANTETFQWNPGGTLFTLA